MSANTEILAQCTVLMERIAVLLEEVSTHNTSIQSHEDIRKMIQDLMSKDTIYTNAQIQSIIDAAIDIHKNTPIDSAHPGLSDVTSVYDEKFTIYEKRIAALEETINSSDEDMEVALQVAIQAIEDSYASVIATNSANLEAAKAAGNTELVAVYTEALTTLMNNMNAEIIAVINSYNS